MLQRVPCADGLLVPAYGHYPADGKSVVHRALGLALSIAAFGVLSDCQGTLVECFRHILRAVPGGTEAYGNHAVDTREVGIGEMLAYVVVVRIVGDTGATRWQVEQETRPVWRRTVSAPDVCASVALAQRKSPGQALPFPVGIPPIPGG